ncbi:MAG: hypothetical protein KDD42_06315, partial [Bdellovibrionales bacterium]|nr:hypothetical protein [Bdellovibrionales bacterium]
MKTITFIPYGTSSQEAGVISLLANYLRTAYPDVSQLVCNGVFSLCDRDAELGWNRDLHSCARCLVDQSALGNWSGSSILQLSQFLKPIDLLETKRWVLSLSPSDFLKAKFRGMNVYEICGGTIAHRFGSNLRNMTSKTHEPYVRRVMLSAIRLALASARFSTMQMFDLALVAAGPDFISRTFIAQCKALGRPVAEFHWEVGTRAVTISHPERE